MTGQARQPICIVAAMTRGLVIGKGNKLPWRIKEEMEHFRRTTLGGTVVMGRRTYESIGMPLPRRNTIVVSTTMTKTDGVDVCRSIDDAIRLARSYDAPVFIIGGSQIYEQALPLADRMVISYIKKDYEGDVYFPSFDKAGWSVESEKGFDEFDVVTYTRS